MPVRPRELSTSLDKGSRDGKEAVREKGLIPMEEFWALLEEFLEVGTIIRSVASATPEELSRGGAGGRNLQGTLPKNALIR